MPGSPQSGSAELERPRPSPLFLAGLIAAAALLLGIGARLRPRSEEPTSAIPSNELATLPELSERRSLRDLADYFSERATSSAPSVLYLPEYQASALALGPDSAVTAVAAVGEASTTGVERVRLFKLPAPTVDSARPSVPAGRGDTLRFRWALVVARTAGGQILSLPGIVGGQVGAQCGDLQLTELIFDAGIPQAFRGGGVFDLDGNAVALAVPCGERLMLVPLSDVARAVQQQRSTAYRLWVDLGFRVVPADSQSAAVAAPGPGLRVSELRARSASSRAGLRSGDLIVGLDSLPVHSVEDLSPLLSVEPGRLALRRSPSGVILRQSR